MSKVSHTPGLWRVAPGYEQRGKWSGHRLVHAINGGAIAMMPKGPHADVGEANARLIAAAPEMLQALRDLVLFLENDLPLIPSLQPELGKAKAAIDKAEGRQP